MGTKTSVTTIVTTVLITLITILAILSMGRDREANIIQGIVLMIVLFVFAGAMIRSSNYHQPKKN